MLYIWEIMLRFSKYKTKHPQSCLEIRIPSISQKIPHHIWTHGIHPKSLNSINKVFEKLLFSSYNKSNFVKQETLKQKKKIFCLLRSYALVKVTDMNRLFDNICRVRLWSCAPVITEAPCFWHGWARRMWLSLCRGADPDAKAGKSVILC